MSRLHQNSSTLLAVVFGLSVFLGFAQIAPAADTPATPYKILATTQIPAAGGIDYVNADSVNRRLYVACGNAVSVFDLDTYKLTGTLANASGHGVAIDPENHTGLVSGSPATFFNTKTLEAIKTIPAPGADGYIFDALTHHFIIGSHRAPNLLVVDSKDGSTVGTVEAIGPEGANASVEQGATDGEGHLYFTVANAHHIAVVDAKTLKVTGHFDLGEKGNGPAGLAIDVKNHILFAMCRGASGGTPTCVILSAADGKIITTLPLAGSSDGATFNPRTMEAFSSHGNGTLSVIKEKSPTEFVVAQTVQTKSGGKTCSLDAKTDHVIVITREAAPAAAGTASASTPNAPPATGADAARGRRGGGGGPQLLDVMFIGR
jgi:outer membrane protein assembly factor BamB